MAFKWGEPCVLYTADTDVVEKGGWSTSSYSATSYSGTTSPFGYGELLLVADWGNGSYVKAMSACSGRCILQGRIMRVNGGVRASCIALYNNGGADRCFSMAVNAAGGLIVYNANDSAVHTTASGVISTGVYHYFCIDVDVGNSSGNVKVWLDQPGAGSTPLINLSSIDLDDGAGTGCDLVQLFSEDINVDYSFCDLACMDSSGAALNAYQGEKRWYVLPPTADGSSVGWTASAGSDYQCVDDTITAASDGDSTYVQGAAGAGAELFTSAALPTGVTGIVYVGVKAEVKKTDGGVEPSTTLRLRETSGGTTVDSSALSITTSYVHHNHGSPDVPGGSGWTKSQADAIEFGLVAA